jgi:hypothetical protein
VGEFESIQNDIGRNNQGGDFYQMSVGSYSRLQAYGNEFDGVYTAPALGDVWSFAVDWNGTSSKFWHRKNGGAWESGGNPATGTTPTKTYPKANTNASMCPFTAIASGSPTMIASQVMNFGQDSSFAGNVAAGTEIDDNGYGSFKYDVPTGFLSLCTRNLPDPAVIPGEHFNAITYTGNGASGHAVTGVGFAPDFVWGKQRDGSNWFALWDKVRGVDKRIYTNSTNSENVGSNTLTSFDADGFTLGSHANNNASGSSMVAWNWKANGAGVSNTNGSITSTVSANVAAGFSIVSYTSPNTTVNETIGHGLSKAPEFIMAKNRDNAYNWDIYHEALAPGGGLIFDTASTRAGWTTTIPDASVFTAKYQYEHESTNKYIAYCFHSVEGYCKVGTYTGNTSVDGTFIYLGFKPAYILSRVPTASGWHWNIYDNKMDTTNPTGSKLLANRSDAEYADGPYTNMDFVSNGIKIRTSEGQANTGEFVYIAFAEQPFKYTNAK